MGREGLAMSTARRTSWASPRRLAPVAAAVAACALCAPSVALADVGNIHVTLTSPSGEALPPSTIVIYDSLNVVAGQAQNKEASPEFDLPAEITSKLTPNKEYTITATADGYSFTERRGTLLDNKDYKMKLMATKTVTVRIQLNAEGVTDYSYVQAAIYDGSNMAAAAKSTASSSPTGVVEFKDVPVGASYSVRLTCPSHLAGQLPEITSVTVPPDQKGIMEVEIKGTTAALDIEEPKVNQVPEPLQKYEAPVQQQQAEQTPRPVSTQPIAQTGDAVVIGAVAVIAVAVVGIIVMVMRRR